MRAVQILFLAHSLKVPIPTSVEFRFRFTCFFYTLGYLLSLFFTDIANCFYFSPRNIQKIPHMAGSLHSNTNKTDSDGVQPFGGDASTLNLS